MKRSTIDFLIRKMKLAYLWTAHVLLAPDHFGAGIGKRLKVCTKGFTSDQYVLYDFDNNDMSNYLSEFDWHCSRDINEPFSDLFNNKVVFAEVFKHYVNVPETLAIKNHGFMIPMASLQPETDKDSGSIAPDSYATTDQILDLITHVGSVFMKPISLGKGESVHRIDSTAAGYRIDGKEAGEEKVVALLDGADGYFLSVAIRQHQALAALFPDAANTMRIITVRNPQTGSTEILFAVLRIGTQKTVPVDNGSRGGLVAKIDLASGVLSEARSLHSLDAHDVHPDTNSPIKGTIIPEWARIKTQVIELARRVPFAQFIAWDILLVNDGICVIEANTSSGVNIIQLWGPQRNGALGDFYRAHGAIK